MELYYLKDKPCVLKKRDDPDYSESFVLESPNGENVFDADIEEVDKSIYPDGEGLIRSGFTQYRLYLNFHYSSHTMPLIKLLEADEIEIPFSFSLDPLDASTEKFVLLNTEAVDDFIHGQYQGVYDKDENKIRDGVTLNFKSVKPYGRLDLQNLIYYKGDDVSSNLLPPANFAVIIGEDPIQYSDDTFYIMDNLTLRKCTVNNVDKIIRVSSITPDYFPYQVCLLRNGNVAGLAYDEDPDENVIYTFDPDLNGVIDSARIAVDLNEKSDRMAVDFDNTLYVAFTTYVSGTPYHNIRKLKEDLTTDWTYTVPVESRYFVIIGVTNNFAIIITQDGSVGSTNDVRFVNKETGEEVDNFNHSFKTSATDSGAILSLSDGSFFILVGKPSGDKEWWKYSEDGTEIDTGTLLDDTYGINLVGSTKQVSKGDRIVLTGNQSIHIFDSDMAYLRSIDNVYPNTSGRLAGKIGLTTDQDKIFLHELNISTRSGNIHYLDIENGTEEYSVSYNDVDAGTADLDPFNGDVFAMSSENPWVEGVVSVGTPNIENVTLTATPETDTVPFSSLIEFGADNTGDADVTINLIIDGVVESSLTIPAGGSESFTISKGFPDPGSFLVEFAGESLTITANGDSVTNDYKGSVEIATPSDEDTQSVAPSAYIDVVNSPSQQSTPCGDPGGAKFNVEWKLTDYCEILAPSSLANIRNSVVGHIEANIPGLRATSGFSGTGFPRINMYSDIEGTDDDGESVIFGVPSSLEQDGGVFSKYQVVLTGGVDEVIISGTIEINIGGSLFATTSTINGGESPSTIAQKIYDACVAVGSPDYDFAINAGKVDIGSNKGISESISLNATGNLSGVSYVIENIEEI